MREKLRFEKDQRIILVILAKDYVNMKILHLRTNIIEYEEKLYENCQL